MEHICIPKHIAQTLPDMPKTKARVILAICELATQQNPITRGKVQTMTGYGEQRVFNIFRDFVRAGYIAPNGKAVAVGVYAYELKPDGE